MLLYGITSHILYPLAEIINFHLRKQPPLYYPTKPLQHTKPTVKNHHSTAAKNNLENPHQIPTVLPQSYLCLLSKHLNPISTLHNLNKNDRL